MGGGGKERKSWGKTDNVSFTEITILAQGRGTKKGVLVIKGRGLPHKEGHQAEKGGGGENPQREMEKLAPGIGHGQDSRKLRVSKVNRR